MVIKHSNPSHFKLILICLAAILTIMLSTACSNPAQDKEKIRLKPGNWVSLDIKFRPNTDEERRDKTIKAIQKMLLNSAIPLMKEYPNYRPSMRITWSPLDDTLHYWLDVINTYGIGTNPTRLQLSTDTTPDKPYCPPCPTTSPCRICDSLLSYPTDPAYSISSIAIVDTR